MKKKVRSKQEEVWERAQIQDKINGIYNRFHIFEEEILRVEKHIMVKYKLSELDALTKLFNLAFDKKLELVLDSWGFHKTGLKFYKIRNVDKI